MRTHFIAAVSVNVAADLRQFGQQAVQLVLQLVSAIDLGLLGQRPAGEFAEVVAEGEDIPHDALDQRQGLVGFDRAEDS